MASQVRFQVSKSVSLALVSGFDSANALAIALKCWRDMGLVFLCGGLISDLVGCQYSILTNANCDNASVSRNHKVIQLSR